VTAFVLCLRLLPSPPRRDGPVRALDLPGAALLTLGVFGLLFPAVEFDADHDPRLAFFVAPALALLACFVGWERGPAARRGHPLVDLALLRIRSYADGLGLAVLFFCAYTGTPLVLALFLQEGLGFSALRSGLTASAYAVGVALSAPIGGRLLNRLGQRLLVGALLLFVIGVALAALLAWRLSGEVPAERVALLMAPALLLAGLGGGSVITPNQALSLAEVDVRGGSTAGGMLQTSQRIGNAVGAAVISAVFYASVTGATTTPGPARAAAYGSAYASGLAVSVAFSVLALLLAVRDVRRRGVPRTAG
jgi:predicted MFS family arabinose efflux permease